MNKRNSNGWLGRDTNISDRHKMYGVGCPATDVDFFLCEYHYGRCVALIEYKYLPRLKREAIETGAIKAIFTINEKLPTFVVGYDDDFNYTFLKSNAVGYKRLNDHLDSRGITSYHEPVRFVDDSPSYMVPVLAESEYVRFLYALRGIKPSGDALDFLED